MLLARPEETQTTRSNSHHHHQHQPTALGNHEIPIHSARDTSQTGSNYNDDLDWQGLQHAKRRDASLSHALSPNTSSLLFPPSLPTVTT